MIEQRGPGGLAVLALHQAGLAAATLLGTPPLSIISRANLLAYVLQVDKVVPIHFLPNDPLAAPKGHESAYYYADP